MSIRTIHRCSAAILLLSVSSVLAQPEGYMDNTALSDRLKSIALGEHATLSIIGQSLGGQGIHLITISGSDKPHEQPALLIVGGLDAQYLVSTEVATRIAEDLLSEHAEMLGGMTIYIVPRANPDGAARNMRPLTMGHIGNARLVDEDRDRLLDEDQPDDLNGDGVITMMRRLEPSLDDAPTHLADPDDQRLNIKPDAKKGQVASFTLYPEGLDNDSDGRINEDPFGSVDLNMNFMHMWPEHDPHAGRYPLSEPETMALVRFMLEHDNIIAAVTLGKHDNLINQPDAKGKDITGRAPKGIDGDDAELYRQAGEWFKEATSMGSAEKVDAAGSFQSWVYAQRGLPSFAVNPWSLPEDAKSDEKKADKPAEKPESSDEPTLTPSPIGDISQETLDELAEAYTNMTGEQVDESMMTQVTPQMIEQFAAQLGIEVRRVKPDAEPEAEAFEGKGNADKKPKKKLSEDAKWLAFFDVHGIEAFVDWEAFDHPTLGKVEIGGFKPGVKINPPADLLDELAQKHTAFVTRLLEAAPKVEVLGPEVKDLGGGLYEVRVTIVNNGELPTTTRYSRSTRSVKPTIVRLSADVDHIITGQRVDRVWGVDEHGGRSEHHWIFRSDDLSSETIEILDPRFGNRTIELSK